MMRTIDSFDRMVLGIIGALVTAIATVTLLGDLAGVPVRDVYPGDGSAPPATASIRITFGQEMRQASVEERFHIVPAVDGALRWDGPTLIFEPAAPLTPGQEYTVTLEQGAESIDQRQLQCAVEWSFAPRDPAVLYLAPADGPVRSLWTLQAPGEEPVELFSSEYGLFNFAVSADGSQIAMTVLDGEMKSEIWLMYADGSDARAITTCAPGSCSSPAWSPDGSTLAYERQDASATGNPGPSRIWLYDVETSETAPVFEDNQVLGFTPRWSPDGSRLAFFDANVQAIRVLEMTTGEDAVVPNQMGEVGSFAPDGSAMVYTEIRPVGRQFFAELWLAQFDGERGMRTLLEASEEDQAAVWSPDGQWIAFARRRLDRQGGWGSQLALYNVQTEEVRLVTDDPKYNNTRFEWSPDSQQILLQRFELEAVDGKWELWIYNLSNGNLSLLVENAFGTAWMP